MELEPAAVAGFRGLAEPDFPREKSDRFVNEVLKCTRQIEENPDRFPTKFKAYKEAQVKTFPFLVIYRINKKANSVRVVSVFHTARNPRKKYK
jgi:plasmid stabilization system protein ParE